ncbi:MAG: DNA repair protein RecN [Desulfuromonadaceae bacterium]|nr:DNA repair protein RecN [Desulfuromonadaceae bacterium]MDD2855853.1 DNA repair protein RecN [Desulfuromonadaceae bacterium]
MLTDLTIKNVAIIDTLHISLKPGLTVLTGETGAGKSIIIDAVGLIMGGRASADLIRSGEDEAVVEAVFDVSCHPEIKAKLDAAGFAGYDELLIKRSLTRTGKNRIFINGSISTLTLLSEIAPNLVNIYGQHDSQTLLKPENHLPLLDSYCGAAGKRNEFERLYARLNALRSNIAGLDSAEREAAQRADLLTYQSEEIAFAALKPGEEELLKEQRVLLANSEKLMSGSRDAFERLYAGDNAILGQLQRISGSISELASTDSELGSVAAVIESSFLQLEDAAITLRDYSSRIEADPLTLQSIDDRLDIISRLKKKYGASIKDILLFKAKIDEELEQMLGVVQSRHELESELIAVEAEIKQCGSDLTAMRADAAVRLKQALEMEADELAMKGAIIEPTLDLLAEPRSSGFERVEFLFSPNPGEIPRSLAKIASGGELSRLMLAIKQVLPDSDVPTLVFDEVDTGIGGATSELVGKKLKNVASHQQVLCITHLPQVAVFADQQLRVEKVVEGGRTSTRIIELDYNQRKMEVARMLAGTTVTESALKHAAEMLDVKQESRSPLL